MNRTEVEQTIIAVLTEFHEAAGQPLDTALNGNTCPLSDLGSFDSLLALEVTVELEARLGCDIPEDNAFVSQQGQRLRIQEVASQLSELLTAKGKADE